MQDTNLLYYLTIAPVPIILAITLHEVSHGLVAKYLGDMTAYQQGRLTLNPLKHMDPIGTVVVPLVLVFTTGFLFGWAKPVPVDPRNFKRPREDMAVVALAGPLSNLAMALFWAVMLSIATHLLAKTWLGHPLSLMAEVGITINLILMLLNLLPVPPLDGGRIVTGLLKPAAAYRFAQIERYGFIILLLLLFTGVLGKILWPLLQIIKRLLFAIVGL
ncbi:MAG: site-2 protease family protein [Gammaproteobacteria bacterium]|nr:site-2 protease family protein [Gammaproteobacteria bacterium]MCW8910644.1 site-2 protease family protein [Gammaproteobacteria bacterium]MCW9005642.1 site-2 protease family protein [Gammaproteobacteria bacterium]MCW9056957.1 site-2 protease family protein [Gammaproteobacteria bacterium]